MYLDTRERISSPGFYKVLLLLLYLFAHLANLQEELHELLGGDARVQVQHVDGAPDLVDLGGVEGRRERGVRRQTEGGETGVVSLDHLARPHTSHL